MNSHRLVAVLAALSLGLATAAVGSPGAHAATRHLVASPILGGDPSMWAPVAVNASDNNKIVRAVQGQTIILNGFPPTIVVESTNASVAAPVPGTSEEATIVDGITTPGATTNPGLQTSDVGAALITVLADPTTSSDASPLLTFIVQVASVTGRDSMLDRPTLRIGAAQTLLAINETGERLTWDVAHDTVISDNTSVLTPIGYPGRKTLTVVGYGRAKVTVSRGGARVAQLVVTVSKAPRFEFRLLNPQMTAARGTDIVAVRGRIARQRPVSPLLPVVCVFHVSPWTRLGCSALTPEGTFTIPAKAMPGTAVVSYRDGGGKGSKYFAINISRAGNRP